jgi:hypothetical protein
LIFLFRRTAARNGASAFSNSRRRLAALVQQIRPFSDCRVCPVAASDKQTSKRFTESELESSTDVFAGSVWENTSREQITVPPPPEAFRLARKNCDGLLLRPLPGPTQLGFMQILTLSVQTFHRAIENASSLKWSAAVYLQSGFPYGGICQKSLSSALPRWKQK